MTSKNKDDVIESACSNSLYSLKNKVHSNLLKNIRVILKT